MILEELQHALLATLTDLAPVMLVVVLFHAVVLRRGFPHIRMVLIGLGYVVLGLTLFRFGLDFSLIPVVSVMAERLARLGASANVEGITSWVSYGWIYAFAIAIGFGATLVEPTLITVADRVHDLTGGAVRPFTLRVVVAVGVAFGLAIGSFRIVTGIPLEYLLALILLLMLLLSLRAPPPILALAYDSGPLATSVVTVPLFTALGIGIAAAVPGRTLLADGFGLSGLVILSPAVSILAVTQLQHVLGMMRSRRERKEKHEVQVIAGTGGRHEG
jgi:hypothetical protein